MYWQKEMDWHCSIVHFKYSSAVCTDVFLDFVKTAGEISLTLLLPNGTTLRSGRYHKWRRTAL